MVQELKKVELVIIIDAACNTCNYTMYCTNRNLYADFLCRESERENESKRMKFALAEQLPGNYQF